MYFFAKCPWLTNTVKGCKKVVSFYSGQLSNVLLSEKNASAAISGLVTPEDFDLSSGTLRHSPVLEFNLNKLSYIHSLNKTKQPFYSHLQCFGVKDILRKNSKKKSKI